MSLLLPTSCRARPGPALLWVCPSPSPVTVAHLSQRTERPQKVTYVHREPREGSALTAWRRDRDKQWTRGPSVPPWSLRRSEKGSGDGLCPRGGDGRAAGPRARAAGSLGLPTPSHRGHSQHPGLRAGGALPHSEERGRDGSVLETGVPRAEWLLPRDMMAAGDWPAPLRWGSGPGPSHRGPWVLFEPQPGDALPLSACGQPSPPPTCWGLGKRRWEEVGAWGPHASRGGREVRGGGAPQPGCGQAPEERGVAPSLGTSRR